MFDDTPQFGFGFRPLPPSRLRTDEIVVDLFAGGGGASTALEQALWRPVDIAINHNPLALALHAVNHPLTKHLPEDVWEADPRRLCADRPVGWLHASPDCTHFSQAKGGQPRSRSTRSLSWVVLRWAGTVRPRIISLENVKEILKWGPLRAKRCATTGRVVRLDGSIAGPGERVPVDQQFLVPDKRHQGRTWQHFVQALRALGYAVEWRSLRACDYGAGTSRERLFLVARRDGEAICWPEPTHGPDCPKPYVSAADCIDWTIPCPSIFTRKRPLADATLRRIARGIKRYVLDAVEPYIVQCANANSSGIAPSSSPLGTITAWPRGGSHAVVSPTLVQAGHGEGKPGGVKRWGAGCRGVDTPLGAVTASGGGGHAIAAATLVQTGYGEREGQAPRSLDIEQPLGTVVSGGIKHALSSASLVKFRGTSDGRDIRDPLPTITSGAGARRPAGAAHALGIVTAHLEQANGGFAADGPGHDARTPMSTITSTGSQQRLVTAHLATLRRNMVGSSAHDPVHTISAGAEHHTVVECTLSPEHEASALRVAAFLMRYHSTGGQDSSPRDPLTTISTRDRLALVTVHLHGTPYVIVDIGLRMLQPHELFRAQGFPPDYVIDRTADGRRVTKTASVAMVGNSVSPPPLRAIAEANLDRVMMGADT